MSQPTKHTASSAEQTINQARVRRAFDRAAENYEQFAVMQNEVCKRLLEKLEIVKISPRYILDAGAGTGSAIPVLFKRYKKAQVVALDLSERCWSRVVAMANFCGRHIWCALITSNFLLPIMFLIWFFLA